MIETFSNRAEGLVKVFFVVDDEGNTTSVKIGNQVVSVDQGIQFYIDENIAKQIDKCELYMGGLKPKLKVKKGYELEELNAE